MTDDTLSKRDQVLANFEQLDTDVEQVQDPHDRARLSEEIALLKAEAAPFLPECRELDAYRSPEVEPYGGEAERMAAVEAQWQRDLVERLAYEPTDEEVARMEAFEVRQAKMLRQRPSAANEEEHGVAERDRGASRRTTDRDDGHSL